MFWRTQRGLVAPRRILSCAVVVTERCSGCGQQLVTLGEDAQVLSAAVGTKGGTYIFCAACGNAIMGHVEVDAARQAYAWVPIQTQSS